MQNECITRVVMRYEEVEQTNIQLKFQFMVTDFEERGALVFKLCRNRSLGEFTVAYESGRRKNFVDPGKQSYCIWKEF